MQQTADFMQRQADFMQQAAPFVIGETVLVVWQSEAGEVRFLATLENFNATHAEVCLPNRMTCVVEIELLHRPMEKSA